MDCVFFDTLVGGSSHDMTVPGVQQDLLRRLRDREFAAVILATPCGPVSILRDDSAAPPLFDRAGPVEPCPPGWESYRETYLKLVDFSCEIIELAEALGIPWLLENPADVAPPGPAQWHAKAHLGSFWIHARVLRMRARFEVRLATFAQCAFGCRFRKWTCIAYSASLGPAFDGWRRFGCVHGFGGHPEVARGADASGRSRSRAAAAYPGRMNRGVADGVARTVHELAQAVAAGEAPLLPIPVQAACDHACAQPPRFASFRNRRPAADAELRSAPFPTLAPPAPPVPRRVTDPAAANPGHRAPRRADPSPSRTCTCPASTPASRLGSSRAKPSCRPQRRRPPSTPASASGSRRAPAGWRSEAGARGAAGGARTPSPTT